MKILAYGLEEYLDKGLSSEEAAREVTPWLNIHADRMQAQTGQSYKGFPNRKAEKNAEDDLVLMVEQEITRTGTFNHPKPNPIILEFIHKHSLPKQFNMTVDEVLEDFDYIFWEHLIKGDDALTTASEAIYRLYLTSGGKVKGDAEVPEYFEDNDQEAHVIQELAAIIEGEIAKHA